jgi:WD40 repeat protein
VSANNSIVFTPDGSLIALGSDRVIRRWSLADLRERTVGIADVPQVSLALSSDGAQLATIGTDGTIVVWNLATSKAKTLRGHVGPALLRFAPDGRTLWSAGQDAAVRIWNLATGACEVRTGHRDRIRDAALSPDGQLLATVSVDKTTRVWSLWDRSIRVLPSMSGDETRGVRFAPDGKSFATVGNDGAVRITTVDPGLRVPNSSRELSKWLEQATAYTLH